MRRVAVILTSYNMPERSDALGDHLAAYCQADYDFICVDNGSEQERASRYTNVWLPKNVQTTGGWLAGLQQADVLARSGKFEYFAYLFLITSAEFVGQSDPLAPLIELLEEHPRAVGVSPALTADSTTAWGQMRARGGEPRQTWMIDNICALWRADWFNRQGRFDPALIYGWGIDLETCYKARKKNKTVWIDERVQVRKISDIGYAMGRMNMQAETRQQLATQNMNAVLSERYGPDWYNLLTKENIDESLF